MVINTTSKIFLRSFRQMIFKNLSSGIAAGLKGRAREGSSGQVCSCPM